MKFRELAELPLKDLQLKLTEMRNDMAELRFNKATQPLDNPLRLRVLRRNVAQAETLVKEYLNGTRKAPGAQ
ncbi:MAG: 50S ribosomal protein L29 [bacterium]|nr:50S ribosomal protein L29 [bacterium]